MGDLAVELRRPEARQRARRVLRAEQIELAVGEVAPVLTGLEQLRIDRLDFRSVSQRLDVAIHEIGVVADGGGGVEDNVQMVEAAEVLEKELKVANGQRPLR